MPTEKNVIPYKVQKGNRPKIEDVIISCLDGELMENALDFAMWMREKKMPFRIRSSNTRWQECRYKGWTLCYIRIYAAGDPAGDLSPGTPSFWIIVPTFQLLHTYQDVVISENLTDIKWDEEVIHGCDPCSGGCGYTSVDRSIFNKEFTSICRWRGLQIRNPDRDAVEKIKRLLELDQQARDEIG